MTSLPNILLYLYNANTGKAVHYIAARKLSLQSENVKESAFAMCLRVHEASIAHLQSNVHK